MAVKNMLYIFSVALLIEMNEIMVNAESCNGATVHNGTNQTIVDADNNIWSIHSDNMIYKNDSKADYSDSVVLLVYWNQTVYQENSGGGWWKWDKNAQKWKDTSDPRPSTNTDWIVTQTTDISTSKIFTSTETSTISIETTNLLTTKLISRDFTEKMLPNEFVPIPCPNSTSIGINCSVANNPCNLLQPCQNNGSCINENDTYICTCPLGFNGTKCQFDYRPCKPNTCWNNGTCFEETNTTFKCACAFGWTGTHCERKINYCANITCQNNAVCRPLLGDFQCQCLSDSFSGRYCEIKATHYIIHQVISKSFAYIAILTMVSVVAFVLIMDMLKYGFNIDPTHNELQRIRQKKRVKKPKRPVIVRHTYAHAVSPNPTSNSEV